VDATRGGPRVGGVAAAPVAPRAPRARSSYRTSQRFAGLVRRRHGVVDGRPGGSPSSTKDEKKDAGTPTWCWRMIARGAHSLGCAWPDRAASQRHR